MKKKIYMTLALIVLVCILIINTVSANGPDEIRNIFPDPILAELVALNLNVEVDEVVTDEELLAVEVLNFSSDEQVADFAGINRLQNLEHLYLDDHGLTSLTPFAELPNLKLLNVEGNMISDLTPLSGLANLEALMLGGNPVSNIDDLITLPALRRLTLFQTDISDLSTLSQLTDLEELNLADINVGALELQMLSELENLRVLDLSDIVLDDIGFLSTLTQLEELTLFNNAYITDLAPLSNLTNLTFLEVVNNQVVDITALEHLTNLETLFLSGNYIEDISTVAYLVPLEILDLSENLITDVRPLLGLSVDELDVSYQSIFLSEVEINTEVPFVVYDLNGQALALEIIEGIGNYENGIIIWTEEDFGELIWNSNENGIPFSGSVMQHAWTELYDEDDSDDESVWLDEEEICPEDWDEGIPEGYWAEGENPCPYPKHVYDDDDDYEYDYEDDWLIDDWIDDDWIDDESTTANESLPVAGAVAVSIAGIGMLLCVAGVMLTLKKGKKQEGKTFIIFILVVALLTSNLTFPLSVHGDATDPIGSTMTEELGDDLEFIDLEDMGDTEIIFDDDETSETDNPEEAEEAPNEESEEIETEEHPEEDAEADIECEEEVCYWIQDMDEHDNYIIAVTEDGNFPSIDDETYTYLTVEEFQEAHPKLARSNWSGNAIGNITIPTGTWNTNGWNRTGSITIPNAAHLIIPTNTQDGTQTVITGTIIIEAGGRLTMNGGTITGTGRGVDVIGINAQFTMTGGVIRDNLVGSNGGGVRVQDGATFVMSGNGSIYNNEAGSNGGGVAVLRGSSFTMNGGEIRSNHADSQSGGGGVRLNTGATFTMNDGAIRNNTATGAGGGVNINDSDESNASSFHMHGGVIEENHSIGGARGGGGGIRVWSGTFTMHDGIIRNNETSFSLGGGGVSVRNTHFTMYGGSIYGNISHDSNGGGVFLQTNTARFTATEGTITNNRAAQDGGGIWTANHDYNRTLSATAYQNLNIAEGVIFNGNRADNGSYPPPTNWQITSIRGTGTSPTTAEHQGHQLNNYDINHAFGRPDIRLNTENMEITVGQSDQARATVISTGPMERNIRNVTWTSSNPNVATVSNTGRVTTRSVGTTIITARTVIGGRVITSTSTIRVNPIPVRRLRVTPQSANLRVGQRTAFRATVTPSNARISRNIRWNSNAPRTASINQSGRVTARRAGGPVRITATSMGFQASATVNVTPIRVTSVRIRSTAASINLGASRTLRASVGPSNAANRRVVWRSSRSNIVRVNPLTGRITGMRSGTATITARSVDTGREARINITVRGRLRLSRSSWNTSATANNRDVRITANVSSRWRISSNASWLRVSRTRPTLARNRTGNGSFRISTTRNTTNRARTGTITVSAPGAPTRRITVRQARATLSVTPSTTWRPDPLHGGTRTFTVRTNSNGLWNVRRGNANWLSVTNLPRNPRGTGNFRVTAQPNLTNRERTGTITVRVQGAPNQTITVRQAPAPVPRLNVDNQSHQMLAMSEAAYNDSSRPHTARSLTAIRGSDWVRFGNTRINDLTGFSMNVYRRHVRGTSNPRQYDYTFAFRGTTNPQAWINNVLQTWGNSGIGQIQDAERLVDEIINSGNRNQIVRRVYFTGHSLGGYLSQWMEARIREGNGVRGSSRTTGATTFNAPGFQRPSRPDPGTHQERVVHKYNNRSRYTSITNYQIAKREGTLRVADPIANGGSNLGVTRLRRSVNVHGSGQRFSYHGLSEFFDILRLRRDFN